MYFTDIGNVGLTNVSDMFSAANWTIEPADTPTTPEPSTLLGLLVIGGAGLLTKRRFQ